MSWEKYRVNLDASILDAMRIIDATGAQFAVVVSQDGTLMGTLTDGDIRRGILRGVGTHEMVKLVMNPKPVTLPENISDKEAVAIAKNKGVRYLPVIDKMGRLIKLLTPLDFKDWSIERENSVILMVGGLGSRLGELTADCPKPMLKVGDRPILELIIENFKEFGFKNFFLSVNYKSDVIERYFENGAKHGVKISYIRETERLGTAGSLGLFKPTNNLPVLVMNGDLLTKMNFASFVDHHMENKFDACIGVRQYDYQIPFGVVHIDDNKVSRIEEKPLSSCLVNAGIYCLNAETLKQISGSGYLDMPVFLDQLIIANKNVGVFPVHEYWLDIGRKDDFIKAELEYFKKFK